MKDTTADPGSAMCTLCGFARSMDANVDRAEGISSAFAFAVHFAVAHPEVTVGASRHVVMVPTDPESHDSEEGER